MPAARWALCAALIAGTASAFAPRVAHCQSAADKATARQLATDGIKLYAAGKYAEALDMLQRAQALYDAPVHLLYLARTQAKLGSLVEAAETYRRLERVQLDAGAPKAFKDAVASASKELAEVEPRVPALRLDVDPPRLAGLELRIDGEAVPAAAVGVDRPANPGEHKIEVWAPGYAKAEASVALAEGERKRVELKLVPGEGPPPSGATAPGPGVAAGVPPEQGGAEVEPSGAPPSKIGFLIGLRLGAAIPSGTAFVHNTGSEIPISEEFKPGGGLELHAGVRFMKYFTGVLFIEGYSLAPGSRLDELPPVNEASLEVQSTPLATGGGISVMVGTERGRFGGFGELGFAPVHNFEVSRDISSVGVQCTQTLTLKGSALRIGGGVSIPVLDFLNLTPYIMASFGSFREAESDHDCPNVDPAPAVVQDFEDKHVIQDTAGHQLFVLGVGGDFLLGRDKPAD